MGGPLLKGAFAIVLLALGMSACFSDLPAPVKCPAPAQRAIGDCLSAVAALGPGCVAPPDVHACFLGPRTSCACGNECPSTETSCFDDGSCPEAVSSRAPGARCIRPSRESFIIQPESIACVCGCTACAQVCDGRGLSVVVKFPQGAGDLPAPLVITPLLPSAGRLGVYVRLRGDAELALVAGRTNTADRTNTALAQRPLSAHTTGEFQELVFDDLLAWTDAAGAPSLLALLAQPGDTAAEIDCVVPFLKP
jgi:hypothetical protein